MNDSNSNSNVKKMRKARKRGLCMGWGINDVAGTTLVNGKPCPIYGAWSEMLKRVYRPEARAALIVYKGCWIDQRWKYFSAFKEWYIENHVAGYELDKDMKFLGNKCYGPDTCMFIPKDVNIDVTITRHAKYRTLIGITYLTGKTSKPFRESGTGRAFSCELQANKVYREHKAEILLAYQEKYKENNPLHYCLDNFIAALLDSNHPLHETFTARKTGKVDIVHSTQMSLVA